MSTSKEWWALGRLGSRSYSPVPADPDSSPLLSATEREPESNVHPTRGKRRTRCIRLRFLLPVIVALVTLLAIILIAYRRPDHKKTPESAPLASEVVGDIDLDDPVAAARIHVDLLVSRQSSTYSRAAAKYSLKTGHPPPRNYDKWFAFAKENFCLIDEYDQIARDFAPFYKLAQVDPLLFQQRIDIVANLSNNVREAGAIVVKDGKVHMPEGVDLRYWGGGPATFKSFAHLLPDMAFVVSGKDQPRVLFDYRVPGNATIDRALKLTEEHPFSLEPRPTGEFFRSRPGCEILRNPAGFTELANDDSGFFISSSPGYFTLDLYPVLSVTKVSPCFADILFPSEYYYDRSGASPKFPFPNNIAWEDKKPQIYWRGTSTGGQIVGDNYRQFTRFRLVDVARAHPDLVDAQITRFADLLCFPEDGCDRDAIVNEYNVTGGMPQETAYKYKYLLDVDGMTYSGRYLGLLRTGSLVFKATVFEEYFNDWLRPYEHYIPVLPDLSDLVEKVEWARNNDEEARAIQERGREMATRVMTDAQNDCYLFALLLEWAQLQEIARNASGTALD